MLNILIELIPFRVRSLGKLLDTRPHKMSQESNQIQTKSEYKCDCPSLSGEDMSLEEAYEHLKDLKDFADEMASRKAFHREMAGYCARKQLEAFAEEMAAQKAKEKAAQNVNHDIEFLLSKLCVMPERDAKLSNEVLQVQKTYEFREAIAQAARYAANDDASRQVAKDEVDRFIQYVHHTPTVNYGFQPVLKAPEIQRDWERKPW